MICPALIFLLHSGMFSTRKGMLLERTAPIYKDLLKMPPIPKLTTKAKMIGRKRPTFSVVSSMMTARENESRV